MGVLGDFPGRIAGVVNQDLLRRNEKPHGGFELPDIERAVLPLKLHQVQRRQVAGGVVDKNIL